MKPGILLLIRRHLRRRLFRGAVLATCAAAVVALQVAAALLDRASRRGLELAKERLGADLVAVPRGLSEDLANAYLSGRPALFYMDRGLEQKISGRPFVARTSPQVFVKSLSQASCCTAWNVFLIGFDPATDFTVRPWLEQHADHRLGPDEVLAGAALDLAPGAAIKFFGHEFTVAGVLAASGSGLDSTVFIPMGAVYRMAQESSVKAQKPLALSPGQISAVSIKLKPESQGGLPAYRAAFELEQALPEISILQPDELSVRASKNLSAALRGLRGSAYAVWPIAALLCGLIFGLAANERQREIGILRGLGAPRSFIFRLILFEALVLAGVGAVAGAVIATVLVRMFSRLIAVSLEVPFSWPTASELFFFFLTALGLALITGALAAVYPAARAAGMEPYEAIRRSEG